MSSPASSSSPALPDQFKLAEFQQLIADRYGQQDAARGTPGTWMWFIEEVGELSSALAGKTDRANVEEEFADVLAWLCTLANINGVDLTKAIHDKYGGDNAPTGVK